VESVEAWRKTQANNQRSYRNHAPSVHLSPTELSPKTIANNQVRNIGTEPQPPIYEKRPERRVTTGTDTNGRTELERSRSRLLDVLKSLFARSART